MLPDQLSLRELALFEKGSLTDVKERREEEEEDGGSLKAEEETVAVAEANAAMLRVFV